MAQNTIIGLKELRENTEHYIRAVGRGKSFSVVRRSRPIFTINPVDEDDDQFWDTVIDFEKIKPGGVPAGEVATILDKMVIEDKKRGIK
jgi:antitoxin (DNA-binding transcriptional repressor) of toxin-antitoxin stability system